MAYEERVTVTVTPDGMIEVVSAVQADGPGHRHQLGAARSRCFPGAARNRIRVVMGDTDRNNGFGSAGSRSLFIGGSSVHVASQRTIDEARKLAADALEAPAADIEYKAGRFAVAGTDLAIGLFELAGQQKAERIFVDSTSAVGGPSWPNACHMCEVRDRSRHRCRPGGRVFVGQRHRPRCQPADRARPGRGRRGGRAIGQALSEHMVYRPRNGPGN